MNSKWQVFSSLHKHWLWGDGWNIRIKAPLSHQSFKSLSNSLKIIWPLWTQQLIKGPSKPTSYLLPQHRLPWSGMLGNPAAQWCLESDFKPPDRGRLPGWVLQVYWAQEGLQTVECSQSKSRFNPLLDRICCIWSNELPGLRKGCRLPTKSEEKEGKYAHVLHFEGQGSMTWKKVKTGPKRYSPGLAH